MPKSFGAGDGMLMKRKGYDVELMGNIRLVDASPEGKVVWELEITPFYANVNGRTCLKEVWNVHAAESS
jgi:hypothetical protein